ncbi:hypothetical protein C0Q70_13967 [Pomacea canaliculata]|uniref:Uncharacterized protein n=1 Tax=Pomacea canaliculata TaxID=400727 RepID=A0A2T7NYR0_POMCA|nr:uncharacterized protein LOC112571096 [Pomacea canaliculata]PVD26296.1 hypothetical protein C0Q70_13967 [Pomacea canaliculata]
MASVFGPAATPFLGCIALLAAEILTIIAFASPYWASDESKSFGLWRKAQCAQKEVLYRQDCLRWDFPWYGAAWQDAVRAMECLAIIFFAIPLIILPVYIYVALGLYYRCLMGCMAVSVLLASVCNIIGVIIYGVHIGSNETWRIGWCLIVCIIGGAFGLISFIIFLIATINKPNYTPEQYLLSGSGFFVDPDRNRLYVVQTEEPVKAYSIYDGASQIQTHPSPTFGTFYEAQINPALESDD